MPMTRFHWPLRALVQWGRETAADFADACTERAAEAFGWVVRRLAQRTGDRHAALIQVKNAAYAWRQAIFLLSFCEASAQMSPVRWLEDEIRNTGTGAQFSPAIEGLAHVISGGRFSAAGTVPGSSGRRFLGWALGPHWYLPRPAPDQRD
jgi:hypothetical protein